MLDQWVAHIGRAGGDVFVYAGAAREKLEARLALYAKQPAERARRGDRTLYVVMDRYGLQTAVKHAVDLSAPKSCALFPDVATEISRKPITSCSWTGGTCAASGRVAMWFATSRPAGSTPRSTTRPWTARTATARRSPSR